MMNKNPNAQMIIKNKRWGDGNKWVFWGRRIYSWRLKINCMQVSWEMEDGCFYLTASFTSEITAFQFMAKWKTFSSQDRTQSFLAGKQKKTHRHSPQHPVLKCSAKTQSYVILFCRLSIWTLILFLRIGAMRQIHYWY